MTADTSAAGKWPLFESTSQMEFAGISAPIAIPHSAHRQGVQKPAAPVTRRAHRIHWPAMRRTVLSAAAVFQGKQALGVLHAHADKSREPAPEYSPGAAEEIASATPTIFPTPSTAARLTLRLLYTPLVPEKGCADTERIYRCGKPAFQDMYAKTIKAQK